MRHMRTGQRSIQKVSTMYTNFNFKTKKELKKAVAMGLPVGLYSPGIGQPKRDGIDYAEGPWDNHKWYAKVTMKDGLIVKVK